MEYSRRELLRAGTRAGLGLSLSGLLRARWAAAAQGASGAAPAIRSCIVLFWYGGPSHLDTFDPKPKAPSDVRGEFRPIATRAPGVHICEHLPRMAQVMDRVALVRGMHHGNRLHDSASIEALTGRPSPSGDREEFAPVEQFFPSYGAVLHRLAGDRPGEVPHAALPFVFHNVVDVPCQGGGFLGPRFDPLQISVDPESRVYQAGSLQIAPGQSLDRMRQRRRLLAAMESTELGDEPSAALRQFYQQAYDLLASEQVRRALDLSQETQATRQRYGFGPPPASVGSGGGGGNGAELGQARQMRGQNLLIARRLVEAGVPFVNVYDFRQQGQNWDAHFHNFSQHRDHLLPLADQGLSALIEDLDQRGLLESTLVVAMGEFGRTPQINREGGRDHWPDCYTVVLAGGGVKGGYVHGGSDRIGAFPASAAMTPADLAATVYWRFGLDPKTEIHDLAGRPFAISTGEPVRELFA